MSSCARTTASIPKTTKYFDRAAQHFPIVEQARQKSFEVLDLLEEQANNWTGPSKLIPRQLPRTDFETLSPEEASASMRNIGLHKNPA